MDLLSFQFLNLRNLQIVHSEWIIHLDPSTGIHLNASTA